MYYMSNHLTALAVIPGLLIIIYVYAKDRVEKEPLGLIIKLLLFGVISCICAGYAEMFASSFLPQYPAGSVGYALINAFALAAFWEEILKFCALKLASWKHPSFNYRFDGVVYGVSAAVGFAVYENIMYVAQFGMQTAIARAFTAVPLHAFCGVFMGVFYAYAKKAAILGRSGQKIFFNVLALVVPMLIHGVYDALAFMRTPACTNALLLFVVFLYIVALSTINNLSNADYNAGFYPKARVISYDEDL